MSTQDSNPTRHASDTPPAPSSVTSMMDWDDWEQWMIKLQRRGLRSFITRYVATKRLEVEKFLNNLDFTISISVNEDTDDAESLERLQALMSIKRSIIKFLRTRKKLSNYNTIEDVAELISTSSKILILTGAGISTSCGIPDFRSQDGLYSQLSEFEELEDVHDMFDLQFFKSNPKPFYRFSKKIFPFSSSPSEAHKINPSDSHRFVKLVESKSKLLRNYTQNIDTLEMRAGVQNLIQCHGSFATFTCLKCNAKVSSTEIESEVAAGQVPLCTLCGVLQVNERPSKKRKTNTDHKVADNDGWGSTDDQDSDDEPDWVSRGLLKPDIIFFGEGLPREFDDAIEADRTRCDLVIVIGTSLAVAPVAEIPDCVPPEVPQVLINRDPIKHATFDVCLLGEADVVVRELCQRLGDGWELGPSNALQHQPKRVGASHVWLFEGANKNHPWLAQWNACDSEHASSQDKDSDIDQFDSDLHQSAAPEPDLDPQKLPITSTSSHAIDEHNHIGQPGRHFHQSTDPAPDLDSQKLPITLTSSHTIDRPNHIGQPDSDSQQSTDPEHRLALQKLPNSLPSSLVADEPNQVTENHS